MGNKFAEWMKLNDKKQRSVAEKLGISASTLHDILKKDLMPSIRVAYEIEKYTHGAVTIYDWIDARNQEQNKINTTQKISKKPKKIKQ